MSVDGTVTGERLAAIGDLLDRGEYLAAYDAAIDEGDASGSLELAHLRVLALARAGATGRAQDELDQLELPPDVPVALREDLMALRARLAKDRASRLPAQVRPAAWAAAAAIYEEVYDELGRSYACVNAASLWFLAGDHERAMRLARRVLEMAHHHRDDRDRYWGVVSEAEAALVLGDLGQASERLALAGGLRRGDLAARASTRRQLQLLCEARSLDGGELLTPLANPLVVTYCGHIVGENGSGQARFPPSDEPGVRSALERWVDERDVGFAYGSLAAGADIIAAEVLGEAGAEVHVTLPFGVAEFIDVSVRPSGAGWVDRFERCMVAATSVTIACDSSYLGDDQLFGHAARISMGRAINHSHGLATTVHQLAVWDGRDGSGTAGTAHDVAVWRSTGNPTVVVPVAGDADAVPATAAASPTIVDRRPVVGLMFGDVEGFSRLLDEHILDFFDAVMIPIATVLDGFDEAIVDRNTWGDGLFVAFTDVAATARCALAIQDAMPPAFRMRLAVHAAPVLSVTDPIRHRTALFGRELTRAARIEPRTPPGQVYATSSFAALLALEEEPTISPEYVGHIATAKDFETIPMYVLRRQGGNA